MLTSSFAPRLTVHAAASRPALLVAACALAIALPALAAPATASAQAQLTPDQIVERALDTNTIGFQTGEAMMTLIIQDASGATRERRMHVRGMSDNGSTRALIRVQAPAEVAGQAYLFRENPRGEDDVFVFLPALDDAPRRIAGSQKNASFMGTHFTYADLEGRDISDARYTRLDDEDLGGHRVYVIDAVPTTGSDYARIRLWIRQSDFIPLRVRFFNRQGEAVKTLFTEQTDTTSSGRVYVRRMTLRPASGGATTMVIDSANFDAAVSASEFTPASLTQ